MSWDCSHRSTYVISNIFDKICTQFSRILLKIIIIIIFVCIKHVYWVRCLINLTFCIDFAVVCTCYILYNYGTVYLTYYVYNKIYATLRFIIIHIMVRSYLSTYYKFIFLLSFCVSLWHYYTIFSYRLIYKKIKRTAVVLIW